MKIRSKGSDRLPGPQGVLARTAFGFGLVKDRAREGIDRLAALRGRLVVEFRKQPKLAAAIDRNVAIWTTLVDSFCGTIDPYISRYFPEARLVAVTTESGDVELHSVVAGVTTSQGPLSALGDTELADVAKRKWTSIELCLRPEQLLQRSLTLPAASRDFLAPIIEHKLERLTPWRPERVLYGYRVLGDAEAGGVGVALTATSKDFVAGPLRALGEAGLAPTAIGPRMDSFAQPLAVNLLRDGPRGAGIDSRRLVSRVALVSLGVLAFFYCSASIWASSTRDAEHEAGIRLLKARRLLKTASMGAVGDRESALLDAKRPDKAMVVLIDKLAAAIPQDTYLKELAVSSGKLRLVGVSGNAPALIGRLEATGLVNVRFTSAVTREKDQKDSFEITADRARSSVAATR